MDLSIVLDGWPFDPDDESNNIRRLVGVDGDLKLQIRLTSGVIQWELDGRPDGRRPYGFDSVLEYCRHLGEAYVDVAPEGDESFELDPDLLEELGEELLEFGRRRRACMLIGDYDHARADATHGLEILELIARWGRGQELAEGLIGRRPQLLADHARACTLMAIRDEELRDAVLALTKGVREIEKFYCREGMRGEIGRCRERRLLIDFRRSLRERYQIPLTDGELLQTLKSEQQVAVEQENYEMAARLRDKINVLLGRIDRPQ